MAKREASLKVQDRHSIQSILQDGSGSRPESSRRRGVSAARSSGCGPCRASLVTDVIQAELFRERSAHTLSRVRTPPATFEEEVSSSSEVCRNWPTKECEGCCAKESWNQNSFTDWTIIKTISAEKNDTPKDYICSGGKSEDHRPKRNVTTNHNNTNPKTQNPVSTSLSRDEVAKNGKETHTGTSSVGGSMHLSLNTCPPTSVESKNMRSLKSYSKNILGKEYKQHESLNYSAHLTLAPKSMKKCQARLLENITYNLDSYPFVKETLKRSFYHDKTIPLLANEPFPDQTGETTKIPFDNTCHPPVPDLTSNGLNYENTLLSFAKEFTSHQETSSKSAPKRRWHERNGLNAAPQHNNGKLSRLSSSTSVQDLCETRSPIALTVTFPRGKSPLKNGTDSTPTVMPSTGLPESILETSAASVAAMQDHNLLRYRVDDRDTSNLCLTRHGVTVTLLNSALWKAFSAVGTEMIINRSGRRMFPYLALSVSGLSPDAMYRVSLQILPASSRRFKYISNRWLPVGIADTEAFQDPYIHTDSWSSGEKLNNVKLIFSKVKLTNNKDSADCNILLQSMLKYRIVTTFNQLEKKSFSTSHQSQQPVRSLSFHFPETDFVAVTAYQNEAVTQMKIHNNPFAKAFRDANFATFRRRVNSRRKRSSVYTSAETPIPAKRGHLSQPIERGSPEMVTSKSLLPEAPCLLARSLDSAGQERNLTQGFLAPGTSPEMGSVGIQDYSTATESPPRLLSLSKMGLPYMSPWMNLYSNMMRSHLLQFQCLHAGSTNSDATRSATPLATTSQPASDTQDSFSKCLQIVPFQAMTYPESSNRVPQSFLHLPGFGCADDQPLFSDLPTSGPS